MLNFAEAIEKTIRIKSVSQDGNEEIANYLQELMNKMGFKTSLQEVAHSLENVSKRQFNVMGILGDSLVDAKTQKGLLLNTHIDTVGPGIRSYWTETGGDPFQATIKEDKIFGLGTADVKLDFLCKLKACERFIDRKLKMPVYLVGTAAEEIGMLGAKFLIKSKTLNPKYVLVGEPSELAVIPAHKAYSVYQVSIYFPKRDKDAKGFNTRIEMKCFGKSAHGSYPDLGENAIHKVIAGVQKVKAGNFQIKLTNLLGGESVNKVPDTAAVEFYLASSSFDDFKRYYKNTLLTDSYLNKEGNPIQVQFGGLGESGIGFLPDNLIDSIEQIRNSLALLCRQNEVKDDTFNPGVSTMNFGKMSKQDDHVDLFFDFRLLPALSQEEFDKQLKAQIQQLNAQFPNLIFKVTKNRVNPGLNMAEDSELVKAAVEAQRIVSITTGIKKKATSTEAAQYFAAGHSAIVFGPGLSMGNSHSPNEYNFLDHLDKAVHFYDRMIERFCL